jgi:hypothetical protein
MRGKIVSENSKKEIEGAKIQLLDLPPVLHFDSTTNSYKDSVFISDNNGLFTVQSRMVGMMYGMPKYRIRLTKDGYQTLELKINKETAKELYSPKDSLYIIKLKGD